jgi:uncharacterized protein
MDRTLVIPRAPEVADIAGILALNTANETELSPLNRAGLQHLMASALYCGVIGPVGAPLGVLIVLDQDALYSSPNFVWFRSRLDRFAYIDRVAIDITVRGAGYARQMYAAAIAAARERNHKILCCEVNQTPPNLASDRFHAQLGFTVVGQATLPAQVGTPAKTVRYLQALIG